jgi:plasmid stabilization system protein ParE
VKVQVVIEPRAERDIDEAAGWIAVHAADAAEHWFDAMQSAIQSLADFPQRCPRARECLSARYVLRQLVFGRRRGRYRLIFTIHDGRVHDEGGGRRAPAAVGLTNLTGLRDVRAHLAPAFAGAS